MVQFIKPLKIKCIATAEWFPKNISPTEWYNVVGFETFNTKGEDRKDEKAKWRLVINFIVINDIMQISKIAAHNCQIVEKDEDIEALNVTSDHEPKKKISETSNT